jgi:hypothetical protein
MFCHDSACNANHKSRDCPILKKLGFKLEKRTDSNKADAASWVTAPPMGDTTKPAQTPAPASNATSGLGSLPGGFSAVAEPVSYDSGDNYDYKGKSSGSMYLGSNLDKPNSSSLAYISLSPSCKHTSGVAPDMGGSVNDSSFTPDMGGNQVQVHSVSCSSCYPQEIKTIYLPKTVLILLQTPRHINQTTREAAQTRCSLWQTREPLTTCHPTNPHLSHTTQSLVNRSAWAITHLPQSVGMVPPSSP